MEGVIISSAEAPGTHDRSHNPNAPDWWVDAPVSKDLEALGIVRRNSADSELVSIWIDGKNRTVYAARGVSQ
jgi:hypothetical protein